MTRYFLFIVYLLFFLSCEKEGIVIDDSIPYLTHISIYSPDGRFVSEVDVDYLQSDINLCARHDTSLLYVPTFEGRFEKIKINGKEVSNVGAIELCKPINIELLSNEGKITHYRLSVRGYNGIPVLKIFTENNAPVKSKKEYVNATSYILNDTILGGVNVR